MPRPAPSVHGKVVLITGAARAVPGWLRAPPVLRGPWPISDGAVRTRDERFTRDAVERGAAASRFIGAGGQAARARAERR